VSLTVRIIINKIFWVDKATRGD